MPRITQKWLSELGGVQGVSSSSTEFWDFPIASKYCQRGETYLRVHEPDGDEEWATDLFDVSGQSVGIVNWPKTRPQLLKLLDALGCITTLGVIDCERKTLAEY